MADLLSQYLHERQHYVLRKFANVSLLYVKKLLNILKAYLNETLVLESLLTKQELKILQMIEMGLSNKQIAEQIQVTAETVKSHVKNLYRKLEVNSRWQALHRGKELNLL
jgi:LuxR family maltose regulon positive regulatory protein